MRRPSWVTPEHWPEPASLQVRSDSARNRADVHGVVKAMGSQREPRPSSVFDRFAEAASEFASHAIFFIACALLVVLWLPSYFIVGNLNTSGSLIINTLTTIITFLLVALLPRTRSGEAILLSMRSSTRSTMD